jgi:integrase
MSTKLNKKFIVELKPKDKPYEIWDSDFKGLVLRVEPSGKKTYFLVYARGKRVKIADASKASPSVAREAAKRLYAQYLKTGEIKRKNKKAELTFEEFVEKEYAPYALSHQKRGEDNLKRLRSNFYPVLKGKPIGQVSPFDIERWRSQRRKAGRSPATVNRDLSILKAALEKARQWGFLKENPLKDVKPLKVDPDQKFRYLTREEEERLRKALDEREAEIRQKRNSANLWRRQRGIPELPDLSSKNFADYLKPLVLLAINTGLRRGELLSLKWQNVNLKEGYITVEGSYSKSGRTRFVPLNSEALDVLRKLKEDGQKSEFVFTDENGVRILSVKSSFAGVLKRAGIEAFRFHDLRHTFASKLVTAGADLNTVRELLGHSDIKMTLRYAHLSPEAKKRAVEMIVER